MKHSFKKEFRIRVAFIYLITFVTIFIIANAQYISLVENELRNYEIEIYEHKYYVEAEEYSLSDEVDFVSKLDILKYAVRLQDIPIYPTIEGKVYKLLFTPYYQYYLFIAKPAGAVTFLIIFIYFIIGKMLNQWNARVTKFESFINTYLQNDKVDINLLNSLQNHDDEIGNISKNINVLMQKNIDVLNKQRRFMRKIEELDEVVLGLDSSYTIVDYNKPWLKLKKESENFIDYLSEANIKKFLLEIEDLKNNKVKKIFFIDSLFREDSYFEVKLIYIDNIYGVIVRDISFTYKKHQEVKYMALHDVLTGLPNRELFMDRFSREIKKAHRSDTNFALLFFDLNDFKDINDKYGHEAGDAVLIEFSKRLSLILRETDTVARWGGDEFLAILPETNAKEIDVAIDKILNKLKEDFTYNDFTLELKTSIGVSCFPSDGNSTDELICKADKAMYESKKSKKDYCKYEELT